MLITPAYTVLNGILHILQNAHFYFGRLDLLLSALLSNILMAFAIFMSVKAVSKPRKRSKTMLINACCFSAASVIADQFFNIVQGDFYFYPIQIIAVLCVIANAVMQKKSMQQKKNDGAPTEVKETSIPDAVEANTETVSIESDTSVAVLENKTENLNGTVLFDGVEDSVSDDVVITVTDEGFLYVGKAMRNDAVKNEKVDIFVEYSNIVEFKKALGIYSINGNGYTYAIMVDKSNKGAIEYIHNRFVQEQNKPHIMRCNVCGQNFHLYFC